MTGLEEFPGRRTAARVAAAIGTLILAADPALAQTQIPNLPVLGAPHDWQMGLQPPYSPVQAEI